MHENQNVNVDQRVYINGGDLVITGLQPTDAGQYTCVVYTVVTDSLDAVPRKLHSNISILSVSGMDVTGDVSFVCQNISCHNLL